jgi:hypothetical protein
MNRMFSADGLINLNDTLSFSDVQSAIKYLRDRDIIVDDAVCSDQFCKLKTFLHYIQNDEDFKTALWVTSELNICRRAAVHTAILSYLKQQKFSSAFPVIMPVMNIFLDERTVDGWTEPVYEQSYTGCSLAAI